MKEASGLVEPGLLAGSQATVWWTLLTSSPARVAPVARLAAVLLHAIWSVATFALGKWEVITGRVSGLTIWRDVIELITTPVSLGWRDVGSTCLWWVLDMAHAGLGLHGVLLGWVGVDTDYWCVLCTAAALLGAWWLSLSCLDLMARTTIGSDIAVTLQDFLGGDIRRVVEKGSVVENRQEILWNLGGDMLALHF